MSKYSKDEIEIQISRAEVLIIGRTFADVVHQRWLVHRGENKELYEDDFMEKLVDKFGSLFEPLDRPERRRRLKFDEARRKKLKKQYEEVKKITISSYELNALLEYGQLALNDDELVFSWDSVFGYSYDTAKDFYEALSRYKSA